MYVRQNREGEQGGLGVVGAIVKLDLNGTLKMGSIDLGRHVDRFARLNDERSWHVGKCAFAAFRVFVQDKSTAAVIGHGKSSRELFTLPNPAEILLCIPEPRRWRPVIGVQPGRDEHSEN
jgi:hypothetical protein